MADALKKIEETFESGFEAINPLERIIVNVLKIKVTDIEKVDFFGGNDFFVVFNYKKGFTFNTEDNKNVANNTEWELKSKAVHFDSTLAELRTEFLDFKLMDKKHDALMWSDALRGEVRIPLKPLVEKAYEEEVEVGLELMKNGKKVGKLYATLLIHGPLSVGHCFKPPSFSCEEPSCLNFGGCAHGPTCGTCHNCAGEKCVACHPPGCFKCDRPSFATCGGCAHGPTCGTCVGCGSCGLPSCSCKCCGSDFHPFGCWNDISHEMDEWFHSVFPVSFDKAHVFIHKIEIKEYKPVGEVAVVVDFEKFKHHTSKLPHTAAAHKWEYKDIGIPGTMDSFKHNNLIVEVFEKGASIGSGEVSLITILHHGFMNEVTIVFDVIDKKFKKVMAIEVILALKADAPTGKPGVPSAAPIANAKPATPAAPGGRKKRESILYQMEPDQVAVKDDHFTLDKEKHLSEEAAKKLILESVDDVDKLVGYQVELFSATHPDQSKGIFVIAGVKKIRFMSTTYCLKDKQGTEKWVVLQKGDVVAGKPFKLHRKVASF